MTDYLPEVYQHFERRYPAVKEAFDALGAAEHDAGPLGERERRLIKLGIAVGAESEGGVRPQAARRRRHCGRNPAYYRPRPHHHRFPCYQRCSELGRGSLVRRSLTKVLQ